MEMFTIELPYEFVSNKVDLTWNDFLFGMENGLIKPKASIQHAIIKYETKYEDSSDLFELASCFKDEPVLDYIVKLASKEQVQNIKTIKEKWQYLLLAWLFENKEKFDDPLAMVELIYADFDYSKEVATFVKYMPATEPVYASKEKNMERMYDNWKQYLGNQEKKYKGIKNSE